MAITRIQRSAATVSWISPLTGLPEVDPNEPKSPTTTRAFLTGGSGFRFTNFTEAWADYDSGQGRFINHGWGSASGIYTAPSFGGFASKTFTTIANVVDRGDSLTFTQIVGARTVSPEKIGARAGAGAGLLWGIVPFGLIGGLILGGIGGETVAHHVKGFPPIWTEIQLTIFPSGAYDAQLLRHSYFPSVTFYGVRLGQAGGETNDYDRLNVASSDFYDAVPKLNHWDEKGWGKLQSTTTGPTNGNPWSIEKNIVTVSDGI